MRKKILSLVMLSMLGMTACSQAGENSVPVRSEASQTAASMTKETDTNDAEANAAETEEAMAEGTEAPDLSATEQVEESSEAPAEEVQEESLGDKLTAALMKDAYADACRILRSEAYKDNILAEGIPCTDVYHNEGLAITANGLEIQNYYFQDPDPSVKPFIRTEKISLMILQKPTDDIVGYLGFPDGGDFDTYIYDSGMFSEMILGEFPVYITPDPAREKDGKIPVYYSPNAESKINGTLQDCAIATGWTVGLDGWYHVEEDTFTGFVSAEDVSAADDFVPEDFYREEIESARGEGAHWQFGYIDADNIPELFIEKSDAHANGVEVYTAYDGLPGFVGEFGSYGSLEYRSHSGYLTDSFTQGGLVSIRFLKLTVSAEAVLTAEYEETETPVWRIDGSEVPQDVYEEKLSAYETGNLCMAEFALENGSYIN